MPVSLQVHYPVENNTTFDRAYIETTPMPICTRIDDVCLVIALRRAFTDQQIPAPLQISQATAAQREQQQTQDIVVSGVQYVFAIAAAV